MSNKTIILLCLLPIFTLSSCAYFNFGFASSSERRNSAKKYQNATISGKPLTKYIKERTALLQTGCYVNSNGNLIFPDGTKYKISTATPIDRRGYFITCAHSLDKELLTVTFLHKGEETIMNARVVWTGRERGFDFALIHVPSSLEYVYEWVHNIKPKEPVIITGFESKDEWVDDISREFIAGNILGMSKQRSERDALYHVVNYSAPVYPGYSGGAIMNLDGQLIGICTGEYPEKRSLVLSTYMRSGIHRISRGAIPNLRWLSEIIEADRP